MKKEAGNGRRDRQLNMRTDDIVGATHKRFHHMRLGKKVQDFFPTIPEVNQLYN